MFTMFLSEPAPQPLLLLVGGRGGGGVGRVGAAVWRGGTWDVVHRSLM